MATLSMIVPVYNEEKLLPVFIKNVMNFVDQLIIVDGSPDGVSTDCTALVIRDLLNDKIDYLSGNYGKIGIWDRKTQIEDGLARVRSNYVCVSSVDMLYRNTDLLKEALDKDCDVVSLNFVEFWLDTKHIKKSDSLLSQRKICKVEYANHYIRGAKAKEDDHTIMYLPETLVCHYGWIRPFEKQVEKHIRNVVTGGWGDMGLKILQRGERALESWAIYHVLKYRDLPYANTAIKDVEWENMSCYDGMESFAMEYQKRYKEDLYKGVMTHLSHDLLI